MKSAAEFKKGKDGTEGLRSDPPGHRQHGQQPVGMKGRFRWPGRESKSPGHGPFFDAW